MVAGLIQITLDDFVLATYGEAVLKEALHAAGLSYPLLEPWVSSCPYHDRLLYIMTQSVIDQVGMPPETFWNDYGRFFVKESTEMGYGKMMSCIGRDFVAFLRGLNNLHLHLSMSMTGLVPPDFRVENVTNTSAVLHYRSPRPGLGPFVVGLCQGVADTFYALSDVKFELLRSRDDGSCDHEVWLVSFEAVSQHEPESVSFPVLKADATSRDMETEPLHSHAVQGCPYHHAISVKDNISLRPHNSDGLMHDANQPNQEDVAYALLHYSPSPSLFYKLFPFHLVVDRDMRVVQAGSGLLRLMRSSGLQPGALASDHFKFKVPYAAWEFEELSNLGASCCLLRTKIGLELKGGFDQTVMPDGQPALLFTGSPRVKDLTELQSHKLFLSDIPPHDMSSDFVVMAEQRQVEANQAFLLEMSKIEFQKTALKLEKEVERSSQSMLKLRQSLEHALSIRQGHVNTTFDVDSPAEKTIKLLKKLMHGDEVDMNDVIQLHDAILSSGHDMRTPMNIASRLKAVTKGNSDVNRSLMKLLSLGSTEDQEGQPQLESLVEEVEEEVSLYESMCWSGDHSVPFSISPNVSAPVSGVVRNPKSKEHEGLMVLQDIEEGSDVSLSHGVVGLGRTASSGLLDDLEATHQRCPGTTGPRGSLDLGRTPESNKGALVMRKRALPRRRTSKNILPQDIPAHVYQLTKGAPDKVLSVLEQVHEWTFDSFKLNEVTDNRPLSTLAFSILKRHGLVQDRDYSQEVRLARFLCHIEDGYKDNPYHCRIHAADVLRNLYVILTRGGVLDKVSGNDPVDVTFLAAIISAVIHDFEHRGVNNDFLIKSADELALIYNDRAPMENHHVSASFRALQQDSLNFLKGYPSKIVNSIRRSVIDMVLSTDMKQHFNIMSMFGAKFNSGESTTAPSPGQATAGMIGDGSGITGHTHMYMSGSLDEEAKALALQMAMKCADLGHLTSSREVHKKWVCKLEEEFFLQGDKEKAASLPVSPLMDRDKEGVSTSQSGFFTVVALPLYQSFTAAFPSCKQILLCAMDNFNM
ncbi:hypothetical protein CEUSTIGMA_g838.t1 [Chlamydomonas eustigma]|uniref:Phosphodiesterase n=1 Tax=Chlamydomonas eustigma TaxID=1157962 RepID=A0A250WRB4_9CHLO|nr:hypothetical protein CEUSTIGMA_g838.t1 [Chlamydomonas eustigma]|eukprot:GAX73385.1 hypothetical protein CEUSTIGMA_g838.t1 [Chlamydomonas eustigma]